MVKLAVLTAMTGAMVGVLALGSAAAAGATAMYVAGMYCRSRDDRAPVAETPVTGARAPEM